MNTAKVVKYVIHLFIFSKSMEKCLSEIPLADRQLHPSSGPIVHAFENALIQLLLSSTPGGGILFAPEEPRPERKEVFRRLQG